MQPFFFIRHDGRYIKLAFQEIQYLESVKNYVRIITSRQTFLVLMALRKIEEELPKDMFCRVHRSFIISMQHIDSFDNDTVQIDKKMIPISEQYRSVLPSRVKILSGNDTRQKNLIEKLDIGDRLN